MKLEKLKSYFNKLILDELKENNIKCILFGGAIRDYIDNGIIENDIDLCFKNEKQFKKAQEYFLLNGGKFVSKNYNCVKISYNGKIYDLSKTYFNSIIDVAENSDMTITMSAISGNNVYISENTIDDIKNKRIVYNNLNYCNNTARRSFKLSKKGYKVSLKQIKHISLEMKKQKKDVMFVSALFLTYCDNYNLYKRLSNYLDFEVFFTEKKQNINQLN